jgi:hypothetical protein
MSPALADLGHVLSPLKPLWDGIVRALQAAWAWGARLFTPLHATREQLAGATANGVTFGRVLGYVLGGIVTAVKWVAQAFAAVGTAIGETIGWIVVHAGKVIDWFGTAWSTLTEAIKSPFTAASAWIGGAIDAIVGAAGNVANWFGTTWSTLTEAIKAPFTVAFQWITSKIDALMAKWQWIREKLGLAEAAPPPGVHWNTGAADDLVPPSAQKPLVPAGGGTTHTTHVGGITVIQQPGEDGESLARRVRAELEARDRAKAAAGRSRLRDTE